MQKLMLTISCLHLACSKQFLDNTETDEQMEKETSGMEKDYGQWMDEKGKELMTKTGVFRGS